MRATVLVWLTLAACGSSSHGAGDDAGPGPGDDAGGSDGSAVPPPPTLGAQIDRMGRAGVAEMLIAVFPSAGADPAAQQAIYGQAADPAMWKTTLLRPGFTIEAELMANIAALDALDLGLASSSKPGCSNTMFLQSPLNAVSYRTVADYVADDQLYLDTTKATCPIALALEIEAGSNLSISHKTCGGRSPGQPAFDALYSILMAGTDGVDAGAAGAPRIHGTATAHTDVTDTFPFLGAPNP